MNFSSLHSEVHWEGGEGGQTRLNLYFNIFVSKTPQQVNRMNQTTSNRRLKMFIFFEFFGNFFLMIPRIQRTENYLKRGSKRPQFLVKYVIPIVLCKHQIKPYSMPNAKCRKYSNNIIMIYSILNTYICQ